MSARLLVGLGSDQVYDVVGGRWHLLFCYWQRGEGGKMSNVITRISVVESSSHRGAIQLLICWAVKRSSRGAMEPLGRGAVSPSRHQSNTTAAIEAATAIQRRDGNQSCVGNPISQWRQSKSRWQSDTTMAIHGNPRQSDYGSDMTIRGRSPKTSKLTEPTPPPQQSKKSRKLEMVRWGSYLAVVAGMLVGVVVAIHFCWCNKKWQKRGLTSIKKGGCQSTKKANYQIGFTYLNRNAVAHLIVMLLPPPTCLLVCSGHCPHPH